MRCGWVLLMWDCAGRLFTEGIPCMQKTEQTNADVNPVTALVFFMLPWWTLGPKAIWEGEAPFGLWVTVHHWREPRQELKQRPPRRNTVYWITSYLARPALLYSPDHQPRGSAAHSRLLHPQLITNQENVPTGLLTSESELPEACSRLRFPLSDGSGGQNANTAVLMATQRQRSRAGMNDLLWDGTVLRRVCTGHTPRLNCFMEMTRLYN